MSPPRAEADVAWRFHGIRSGAPLMWLIVMSLFGVVAIFLPWIAKWGVGVERDLLIAHARQAVDGGPVEEGRE